MKKKDRENRNIRFIFPERELIVRSKASSSAYTNPLISIVFWDRFKTSLKVLQRDRYGLVLEIGCYHGFMLPTLCNIADKVIATDIEHVFKLAWKMTLRDLQKSYTNLECKVADVVELSKVIGYQSCDVIFAFSVLEHVDEPIRALDEIYKVLKLGGTFICELPSENWLYKFARKLVGYKEAHEGYSYINMRKLLRDLFTEIKVINSPLGIPLFKIGAYEKR